jgi:chromosome segregation ATPase
MTIDVNIPESAIEELTDRITDHVKSELDLTKIEDLESRLEDLESKVEDIDTDEFASTHDFTNLEERVNDLEEADYQDLDSRISDLERYSDTNLRNDLSGLYKEYREFKSEMLTLVESFRKVLNDFVSDR